MKYCKICLQPNTRVNEIFSEKGCCSACENHFLQNNINYLERFDILKEIISKYPRKKGKYFDCIIGVSGGKDSTRQAIWVRDKLKLKPLLVCLSYPPEQVSELGVKNISNLINLGFDVVYSAPAPGVWKNLMREAFLRFANWARSTELALYSSVPKTALAYELPLIFIGENQSLRDRKTISPERPWEYNNLMSMNTLAGGDLTWMREAGFSDQDLIAYGFPDASEVRSGNLNVIDLGWFIGDWDNLGNAKFSTAYGISIREDGIENIGDPMGVSALDEDWVTLNQMIKYFKFGFGKVTDYVNEDIRAGRMSREKAIPIVEAYDGACSSKYIEGFCEYIDITVGQFWETVISNVNRNLFEVNAPSFQNIHRKYKVGIGL
ncbi:N-acetyl sugar amidotransferase [Leptospira sp. 201903070]|uniref:N-acetyl sugar amidotransferase n=1 Tax=Leptospira ainlahdjerensis TaxID=2810033 RepID=A0ABS2UCN9_9LEPT|nr:N-acetyl sugar amidotransferase [Leptospira ainlahdjerensis]MBM9577328.1 N-acetyl sugar amidotransferase [Leptospira ainlahdjerensis]